MNAKSLIDSLIPDPSAQIETTDFVLALIISAVAGGIVSLLYQKFYRDRATGWDSLRSKTINFMSRKLKRGSPRTA